MAGGAKAGGKVKAHHVKPDQRVRKLFRIKEIRLVDGERVNSVSEGETFASALSGLPRLGTLLRQDREEFIPRKEKK